MFEKLFKSKGTDGSTVDAMLVLCVHEPDVTVNAAAGAALMKLARKALAKVDPSLHLKKDAYVRFGLLGSGAVPGLPPGAMDIMSSGMATDMIKKMHYLSGGKSLSQLEDEAEANLPGEMKKLMQERDLAPDTYELKSFKESPDPGVMFLWIAAIRKKSVM